MKIFGFTLFERGTRDAERGKDAQRTMAISVLNPQTGRTGAALRPPMPVITPEQMLSLRAMEKIVRAYDAGQVNNYNADFRGTYGSANTEIFPQRYTIRARGRTLQKDTPHGKAVTRAFQNNVVGDDPFKLEMRVGQYDAGGTFVEEKETNRAIEAEWNEFIKKDHFTVRKTMSFMEAMRAVEAELVAPGSVICRLYDAYPFNRWGFAVDFLEEDRLQETYQGKSPPDSMFGGGNPIRASIEYHPTWNFPVAYWLLTRHPGEAFYGAQLNMVGRNPADSAGGVIYREQVSAVDVIHFNNLRDRVEQDWGMTELDATVQPLWRIHQYEKALTLSSIASASKPFWIEKEYPTGFQVPEALREQMLNTPGLSGLGGGESGDRTEGNGSGTPETAVVPGARETLAPGLRLKQADPKFPIEAAHEFRQDNLRDIAVGTSVSYQHVSGDFQNLGFIAGLMCQIPFQDNCKVRQNNLIDGGVDKIFRRWLRASIMKGVFDFSITRLDELCRAAHFKGKGFQFVNPLVQAQALILLNEAGHLTRQQVQDQLPDGMNFEKLVHALKNEKEEMEAAGLNFQAEDATDPSIFKGDPGQTKPAAEGGDAPSKSKVQSPRTKGRRLEVPMDALLEMSRNGH